MENDWCWVKIIGTRLLFNNRLVPTLTPIRLSASQDKPENELGLQSQPSFVLPLAADFGTVKGIWFEG